VLLVTVDTLRADHLGAYGYPVPTSPAIDRLAAGGVRAGACVATAPETAPATASLLTGLYQYRTRVFFNRGTLPPDVTSLAEDLRAAGYTTAGLVGNGLVGAERGFSQGFDHFERFDSPSPLEPSDARGVDRAIAWLRAAPARPWLLWIHLMDPHGPYTSAGPEWSAGFAYPPGTFEPDDPLPPGAGNFGLGVLPKYQQLAGLARPSELVRRYDGEIRFTDAQIARLLDALEELGQTAATLVVLTADHGESLTEHREYFQHGWFLYDTTLRVPLVLSWPGVLPAGAVVRTQVSGVDLVPTLHEILGTGGEGAAGRFDGTSFARRLFHDDGTGGPPAFAVGARENHPFAVRHGGWKLVHTPAGRPAVPMARLPLTPLDTPERFELYDLAADPGETRDLIGAHPERADELKAALAAFRERFRLSGRKW
jgi:arylsulfatase A-like enzyme